MLEQILQEINDKSIELKDQINSFEFFYRVVVNDNTTMGLLNAEDIYKIIDQLNLTTEKIFIYASENGHMNTLKYLVSLKESTENISNMIHADFDYAFRIAAENGHIDILKYLLLLEENPETRSKMIHVGSSYFSNDYAFKSAAENGHIETLKYLVSLEKDTEARSKMIHADFDYAFRSAAENGHIDTLKYLVSLEENSDVKSKMIHADSHYFLNDYAFRSAAGNGHIEILKYLLSLEEDTEVKSKMIHTDDDDAFRSAAKNGHIDTLKYLVSLEKDPESRSKMIHANNYGDNAFKSAAKNGQTDTLKYLVVSDPFYEWPKNGDITNLNYYKNIDIKSLCKISILCKYLFSNSGRVSKNNKNNIGIIDLPTEIIDKILQNLAQVDDEHSNRIRIESVVKAFTYDSSNYLGGFKGFTYRYESALKEHGAIDNIDDLE